MPYWSIILLDCLVILFSGLLVYALNNGIFATMGIFWHLSLTWGVCLVPYLVGFRLFRTYSGIIRYSSFVDLQRVGFAVLFGVVCVVTFQEFTDFSPYLVYIRKRDLVLSSLLAMSLMWAMRVFVKYFYVTTFRQSKAERAFIFGVKQGGISLAKSIQNQDPAQYVLAGIVSEAGNMQNRILMGVRVYPFDEELIDAMRRERATILFVSPLKSDSIREQPDMVARLAEAGIKIYVTPAAQEWDGRSDLTHTQLRKVEIEDLLPREKIEIDMEAVGRLLRRTHSSPWRSVRRGCHHPHSRRQHRWRDGAPDRLVHSGSLDLGRSGGDPLARHPLDDGEGLAGYQRLYLGGGHR